MSSIEKIAETLRSEAVPGMKPKELIAAVRRQHPDASKKEIVRAAFYTLIEGHGVSEEHRNGLHAFAIGERGSDEEADVKAGKLRKKKKQKGHAISSTVAH